MAALQRVTGYCAGTWYSDTIRHGSPFDRRQTVLLVTGTVTASPALEVRVKLPVAVVTARSSLPAAQPVPGFRSSLKAGSASSVSYWAAIASPPVAAGLPGTKNTASSA